MKIDTIEVAGMAAALTALRLPFGKEVRSWIDNDLWSDKHIDCQGLTGDELVQAKASIPMGKELTKVDAFSYQALRNIVKQRWNHRLPEWHLFVDWVKTLPFAQELILEGLEMKSYCKECALYTNCQKIKGKFLPHPSLACELFKED